MVKKCKGNYEIIRRVFYKGKDEEELYYIVESRIFPKMFVRQMLYHKAMLSAEQEAV